MAEGRKEDALASSGQSGLTLIQMGISAGIRPPPQAAR